MLGNFFLFSFFASRVGNNCCSIKGFSPASTPWTLFFFSTWLTLPQANDRHLEAAGQTEMFRKHPRKASILNMPLVTTLFYSCFYHYTEAEVQAQCERKIPHTLPAREELSLKPVFRCTL